jgi:signal peptidase II
LKRLAPHSLAEQRFVHRALALAGSLLLLDQATKIAAEQMLTGRGAVVVIPGLFNLVYVTNKGAAWGMFSDLAAGRWLLLGISLVVTVLIAWQFRLLTEGHAERFLALGMVLSGIAGNGIDRMWRGAVVDFLDFHLYGRHWPAFNVADSAICVGVTIFVLSSLLRPATEPDPPSPGTC